jgi:hypothetical protein
MVLTIPAAPISGRLFGKWIGVLVIALDMSKCMHGLLDHLGDSPLFSGLREVVSTFG